MATSPFVKSERLQKLPPYLFAEIDKKKKAAIAAGRDVINLGVGDPDRPTPAPLIRRLQHERIERARFLHRLQMGVGQLKRGERFFREAITGLGERHRCQRGHLLIGLQKNGESVLSLAGSFCRALSAASS